MGTLSHRIANVSMLALALAICSSCNSATQAPTVDASHTIQDSSASSHDSSLNRDSPLNRDGSLRNQDSRNLDSTAAQPDSAHPQAMNLPIKHIIFLIKENRSFDNYFGTFPGVNGATTAVDSTGATVPLQHQTDTVPDIDHSSEGALMAYDNGKMDLFDKLHSNVKPLPPGPYGNNSLTQLLQEDIPNYWTYAEQFVIADQMFSSLLGPSFPNHLYAVAAQSGGADDNPSKPLQTAAAKGWGCDQVGQTVKVKFPDGGVQ